MLREIKNAIYCIASYTGNRHFVECDSESYGDNDKSEIRISGKEIPLCEDMGVIYEGNYMDFLLQYNNKESETQLYRLMDVIRDDEGSISGTKLDFIW